MCGCQWIWEIKKFFEERVREAEGEGEARDWVRQLMRDITEIFLKKSMLLVSFRSSYETKEGALKVKSSTFSLQLFRL